MTDPKKPRLAAILLAAGGSERLGQPKQLVQLDGEVLVRRAARLMLAMDVAPAVVVTGHQAEAVSKQLHDLPLDLVHNPEWERGMGHSIACGAQFLPAWVDGVLLMLCDQWKLQETDLVSLVTAWAVDISGIVVTEWKSKSHSTSGPPVIFPSELIPELKLAKGEVGAKSTIDQNRSIVRRITLRNAKFDLDRPQDLALLQKA